MDRGKVKGKWKMTMKTKVRQKKEFREIKEKKWQNKIKMKKISRNLMRMKKDR